MHRVIRWGFLWWSREWMTHHKVILLFLIILVYWLHSREDVNRHENCGQIFVLSAIFHYEWFYYQECARRTLSILDKRRTPKWTKNSKTNTKSECKIGKQIISMKCLYKWIQRVSRQKLTRRMKNNNKSPFANVWLTIFIFISYIVFACVRALYTHS